MESGANSHIILLINHIHQLHHPNFNLFCCHGPAYFINKTPTLRKPHWILSTPSSCTRMHGVRSLILALLAAVSAGFAMSPHEEVHTCPDGFVLHGPADPETRLDLRIALRQNDIAGLETVFLDISNPDSPQYGRHLSQQQVDAYVEPSIETTANVHRWLSSHNLTASNVSHAGDWIQVSVPVGKANNMLNANFSHFSHAKTGGQAVRTLTYSIPTELQSHIDLVHPTVE